MRPIRLADAIAVFARKDLYGFQESTWAFIDAITGGDIVTPADETLARMTPYAVEVEGGWDWDCCGRPTNPLNVPTRYDQHATECEWLKASIKVDALEGQ